MFEHQMEIRVYYADTDALGIVYHATYLRFFESARTESLRARGFELPLLMQEHGIQFAVVHIDIKYLKPARFNDKLLVQSKISNIGRASITYQQEIYLSDTQRDLLCEAQVKLVTIDKNMRPQPVPDFLKL